MMDRRSRDPIWELVKRVSAEFDSRMGARWDEEDIEDAEDFAERCVRVALEEAARIAHEADDSVGEYSTAADAIRAHFGLEHAP